jgi:hypothetical protein
MGRTIIGVVAGFFAWMAIVTVLNWGLRLGLPGYSHAEPAMAFTLVMQVARLSIAAIASLMAGALVQRIAPLSRWAPWGVGLILLVLFVPIHIALRDKFPLWYHLTFLLSLVPLVVLGAKVVERFSAPPA